MNKKGYRKGVHTALDLKYHCLWRTKYNFQYCVAKYGGILSQKSKLKLSKAIPHPLIGKYSKLPFAC